MRLDKADVVVIGGGVTGLSSAFWLAKAGVDVVVVDAGVVGYEASSRNGGMVGTRVTDPEVVPLAAESLRLWPALEGELGYPTEYAPGNLRVALNEEGFLSILEQHELNQRHEIDSQLVDPQAIREMAPLVSPHVVGGMLSRKTGGHANPQRTVQAFAWAVQDRGRRIHQHTVVTGFKIQGDRVTAVQTSRGDIETGQVIAAAGPHTALLAALVGADIPLAPARVEIAITEPVPPMFSGAISGNGVYGRQTMRGNLAYGGGPHEWTDVTEMGAPGKPNTPLIRNIARRIYELFGGAGDVALIRSWAGIVEETPDYLPILDFLATPRNYLVACVSGHGFGLCPATGKVVSELVLRGETSVDISALKLARFADVPPTWREERRWSTRHYNT